MANIDRLKASDFFPFDPVEQPGYQGITDRPEDYEDFFRWETTPFPSTPKSTSTGSTGESSPASPK